MQAPALVICYHCAMPWLSRKDSEAVSLLLMPSVPWLTMLRGTSQTHLHGCGVRLGLVICMSYL